MRLFPQSIGSFLATTLMAVCLAGPASADTLLTLQNKSEGLREPQTAQTWFADKMLREDKGKQTTIVNLEEKKIWLVMHESKTYHELDLPVDLRAIVPPDMHPFFDQLDEQMNLKVKIEQTDETKTLNGFKVKRVNVEVDSPMGVDLTLKLWMTDDPGFDFAGLKRLQQDIASTQPMAKKMMEKISELKGYPVLTEITANIQGQAVESTEEMVSVQTITAPEGTYTPPRDYKMMPFDYMKLTPPR